MKTLVLDGGGQLGCFTWGILIELHLRGLRPEYFDTYIATSAGVFNASYFATKQIGEGTRIWTQHLPQGFWKWNKNDMAYLERVLRKIEPLHHGLLEHCSPTIYAALTNPKTLTSELICLNTAKDRVGVMLASAAMPFLTGPRTIDGKEYYDAGLVSQPPIEHAQLNSGSETWVLLTTPHGYRAGSAAWKMMSACALHNKKVRALLKNCPAHRNRALQAVESNLNLKVIRPETKLPIHWRSNNLSGIARTFELGREAGQRFAKEQKW